MSLSVHDYPLVSLRLIRRWLKSEVPEKYFNTIELELTFLATIFKYTANRCIQIDQNFKDVLMRAEAAEQMVSRGLKSLNLRPRKKIAAAARTFKKMAARVSDMFKIMRPEMRRVHRILSGSSPSHNHMSNKVVIEFIDSLLENLKCLISFKANLVDHLKVTLEALQRELRFLKTFLLFAGKMCTEHEKLNDFLNHAKVVTDTAAYLCYSCLVEEMNKELTDTLVVDLSDLLQKIHPRNTSSGVRQVYIKALKASSVPSQPHPDKIAMDFVETLLETVMELSRAAWTVPMRDQLEDLKEELTLLRCFLKEAPELYLDTKILSDISGMSKVIFAEAGSVAYSLYDKEMNGGTTKDDCSSLVDLFQEIKLLKVEITECFPMSQFPKFPRTDGLGFFDSFLANLGELLNKRTDSITRLNLQVEELDFRVEQLGEDLHFLRAFLGKIVKRHTEQGILKVLSTQTIEVAYKAEYIIDSLLVENCPRWPHLLWLSGLKKEIKILKAEINGICSREIHDSGVHHGVEVSTHEILRATPPERDEVFVGFQDEEEKILEDLVRGSTKLEMVSIVGMPGLGKTHLAKKIYNHPTVKDYFHVCAWCYVSQVYKRKYLLTSILSQIRGPIERQSEMKDEDLAEALYRSLKGKRYFIILDDLWEVEAWNALTRSFPDDNNGSRIMFTSRFHSLDLKSSRRKIHHLRPFSDNESWQLLQEKIFQSKRCPPELLEVGTKIAKNCNGLPLAVVLAAGILARIEKNQHQWREVANNQSSYIADYPNKQSIKVIELSYNHLPDYLKSCFLYTGALFARRSISVRKLICHFVAEGFVRKAEGKSLEDIAAGYLTDLIGRSLIIVTKRRSTGDTKECRIHDLISDFCLEKAKEDRFFQLIERFPASDSSREIIYEERRICSHRPDDFLVPEAYGPLVRTLFFRPSSLYLKNAYDVSSFCYKFKLLNVLDLEKIWIWDTFPDGITSLAHLSYLLICGYFDSIPPSIAKLGNLETFIVKGSTSLVRLPDTIWNMVNLRHLHVSDRAFLSRPSNGCAWQLDNLQAVSTLFLSSGDDTEELLKGFMNVKNLRCIFFEPWDYSKNHRQLPGMATLNQLESLWLSYEGKVLHRHEFSFPSNIRKLTLSEFHFPWKKISTIGKLPNIEVLKLLSGAFEGEEWEMGDGEFPKLKLLKLKNLEIRKWSVSSDDDQFPPLQQLVLQSCPWLEEVPSCLRDIPTLDMIEVSWCSECLKDAVKQIQEEQLDMGNQDLRVIVK